MPPDFSSVRALAVGDLTLDRYHHGAVSRISPEAAVQVVQVERSEDQPDGAAANLGAVAWPA